MKVGFGSTTLVITFINILVRRHLIESKEKLFWYGCSPWLARTEDNK